MHYFLLFLFSFNVFIANARHLELLIYKKNARTIALPALSKKPQNPQFFNAVCQHLEWQRFFFPLTLPNIHGKNSIYWLRLLLIQLWSFFLSSLLNCATSVAVLETFPYRILRAISAGIIISLNSNTFYSISNSFSINNSLKISQCYIILSSWKRDRRRM